MAPTGAGGGKDAPVPINYVVSSGRGAGVRFVVHHAETWSHDALRGRWWSSRKGYACWASCGADPARVAIGWRRHGATHIDFPDWEPLRRGAWTNDGCCCAA